MATQLLSLDQIYKHGFDTLIDVRSPAEFAEDHVPDAINLPVLSNEERARVGAIYKQGSPFLGRKIGAALVFRNAAAHIEGPLAHHEGHWRPLIYCWRGGQRSGSFAWLLKEIGWRSDTIQGGYKSYRKLVVQFLHQQPLPYHLVQLGGYTGTAKTEMLTILKKRGVQVVDLEALAQHRGSLLGEQPEGQPAQKMFESRLAMQLIRLDPSKPALIEAESSKIGKLNLPPSLWAAMKVAPWIEVTADLTERGAYLNEAYDDILSDLEALRDRLDPLRLHRGHAVVDHWHGLIAAGDRLGLVHALMSEHYDPAYRKSMKAYKPHVLASFKAPNLSEAGITSVAEQICAQLQTMSI